MFCGKPDFLLLIMHITAIYNIPNSIQFTIVFPEMHSVTTVYKPILPIHIVYHIKLHTIQMYLYENIIMICY